MQIISMTQSTHPHPTGCEALAEAKTPSAREGVYFGLPRATSCARNDIENSCNDKIAKSHNDKKTHPQTPSAREGVYFGLPRSFDSKKSKTARNDGSPPPQKPLQCKNNQKPKKEKKKKKPKQQKQKNQPNNQTTEKTKNTKHKTQKNKK
ncbi:hypothetical protein [Helicobacter sp. T3_23-1056]